jgi:DNA-binding MarR family transcriptional regulator
MPHDDPEAAGLGELMHAAFRRLRRRWVLQLEPFGLTPHQFRALNAIARMAGPQESPSGTTAGHRHTQVPGLRLKDLADKLHIVPRSATEVVDLLQDKGLVDRGPDPSDRRATLVSLTPRGVALREKVRDDRRRDADEFFSRLDPHDQTELERLLRLLAPDGPAELR